VFGSPSKKYFQKSLEIEKTVLSLSKSNGKRNKPNDKQKTILKIKLKNSFRNETEKPKEKKIETLF